jgi:hypothetical protein
MEKFSEIRLGPLARYSIICVAGAAAAHSEMMKREMGKSMMKGGKYRGRCRFV